MRKNQILNFQQSRHLVERSGMGVDLELIKSFVGQSLGAAISRILSSPVSSDIPPPALLKPSISLKTRREYNKKGQRQKSAKLNRTEKELLKVWGLKNLLKSENLLQERMVWFWHNHFTSSIRNVHPAAWMLQQDQSIRMHALGRFSDLLSAMTFDPAMLIYLDGKSNRKDKPNENFARELLEIFTLGEGHYTEVDIKEAARAFTGWTIKLKKNKVVFRKKFHDSGVKIFMGQKGNFSADDIIEILLKNLRTAEFISEKLWHEFVSIEPPEPLLIKSWASLFVENNYEISKLLIKIFESDAFWDKKYHATLIKSPIDLVAGSLRTFNFEDQNSSLNFFVKQLQLMGQDLYTPPNVKGWVGGKAWINDDSLLRRKNFLRRIMRGQAGVKIKKRRSIMSEKKMTDASMSKNIISMGSSMRKNGMGLTIYELPDLSEKRWEEWLLPIPAITPVIKKSKRARLRSIVLDPAYQLK